jgi:hypothetical protein
VLGIDDGRRIFQQVGPGRKLKTEASRDLFPRAGARHEAWQQSLSHRCEFGWRQSAHYRETHVLHAILFHFRSFVGSTHCRSPLKPERLFLYLRHVMQPGFRLSKMPFEPPNFTTSSFGPANGMRSVRETVAESPRRRAATEVVDGLLRTTLRLPVYTVS